MKYILDYLKEEMFINPVENAIISFNEEMDSDMIPIGYRLILNGKDVNIVVWHADYSNWLEKKYDKLLMRYNNVVPK